MKPFFSILTSILSFILIFNLGRELIKLSKAGEQIEKSREKIEQLRLENWRLKQEKDYYLTDEFLEKEIRDKLGMARQGDVIAILPEEKLEKIASRAAIKEEEKKLPVWQQWLEIFW